MRFALGGVANDSALLQKLCKWLDQVFNVVELIVVHLHGVDGGSRSPAGLVELLGLLVGDEGVAHAVDQESRTPHLRHFINVSEPVSYKFARHLTRNFDDDVFDAGERGNEEETAGTAVGSQVGGWP